VWSFNMRFDPREDYHTEASLRFLARAGINLRRLARDGIDVTRFGQRLGTSQVFSCLHSAPLWVTFSGSYDLGYLYKLHSGLRLPTDGASFDDCVSSICPRRYELREKFPHGSLESLVQEYGLVRRRSAHTAGSDALATLELFLMVVRPPGHVPSPNLEDLHCGIRERDPQETHPWVALARHAALQLHWNDADGESHCQKRHSFVAARQCVISHSKACLKDRTHTGWTHAGEVVEVPRSDRHPWVAAARAQCEEHASADCIADCDLRHSWVAAAMTAGQADSDELLPLGVSIVVGPTGLDEEYLLPCSSQGAHPWLEFALRECRR